MNTSKTETDTSLLELFKDWLESQPEFDIKRLAEQGCWPVTKAHYRKFTIKKRNGSDRQLVTVDHRLKEYQSNLRRFFEKYKAVSKYAYGFVSANSESPSQLEEQLSHLSKVKRPRGVVSNALAHTSKKVVISLDLKDFFPSITFPRVMGLLCSEPFSLSRSQAAIVASLVCLPKDMDEERGLPQGAPTSPIISNLICNKLDYQLGRFAKRYDLNYTRYADDLTLSTNNLKRISPKKIIDEVTRHVERNGFAINEAKTKVMYKNSRQMVTGILVNDGLNLHKKHVDALRATLYNLEFKYDSVDKAVINFLKLENKQPYDAFVPLGYYKAKGMRGRFISSSKKGIKRPMPINKKEMHKIYALHLLGRILWYGQVVTTAVQSPYDLSKRPHISSKQHSRIKKYEEMLASFYRVSIKFKWPVEHIILRLANRFNHLQSLVAMQPNLLLEPIILDDSEQKLKADTLRLKKKEDYLKFVEVAPESLRRAIRSISSNPNNHSLEDIKQYVNHGWPVPEIQREVFKQLDTGTLSNLFHKSYESGGHSVNELLEEIVKVVKTRLRYLSPGIRRKILSVHRELLAILRLEGNDVRIDLEKEVKSHDSALQAIRDLKAAIRLYEDDTENFYNKIVLPAVKESGMSNIVKIDSSDMEVRLITDIAAWRNALIKVLDSVKEHMETSERVRKASEQFPFTLKFREANPETEEPMALELYRTNVEIGFKKIPDLESNKSHGLVKKRLTGGDLSLAVKEFLPIGDIYVLGKFERKGECIKDISINLTDFSFVKCKSVKHSKYGQLMFALVEKES